jgi:hypothetical protein
LKIELRVVPTPAARDALSRDALIAAEVDLDQIAFVLDAEAEPIERLLEITRDGAGSMFFPVLSFDAEELAVAALVQPQSRRVTRETDRDYRLNNERLKTMGPFHVGADFETRLLDRINRTAEPFTWFGSPDWVLTRRVLEVYERRGMKGWAFLPVLEQGTPLQREFSTRFDRVRARIASNPRNLL